MSKHLMTPDPEREAPSLRTVLWVYVFILAVVVVIGLLAKSHGG